tara:strand:+ start:579 stop:743 length:165 start_codon:yes stop_codon:yes gene_type:complete
MANQELQHIADAIEQLTVTQSEFNGYTIADSMGTIADAMYRIADALEKQNKEEA